MSFFFFIARETWLRLTRLFYQGYAFEDVVAKRDVIVIDILLLGMFLLSSE